MKTEQTMHKTKEKYPEYKTLNLPELEAEVLKYWEANSIFAKSVSSREGQPEYIFYEGPPSANGKPGIHHVMSRTVKDLFCRYQTLKGKQVKRKGGWDTHGLPIEISLEKRLNISKEDIGKKISIEEYNRLCRESVMEFKEDWDRITVLMGYWVDLDNPYITFESDYIESVWHLLSRLYEKDLLYKGFTIQPYSPAAGTGLSTHELNQVGAYRNVKDTTCVAMFKVQRDSVPDNIPFYSKDYENNQDDVYFTAWTTTPWTLSSNTALAVGENIRYFVIRTVNPYTDESIKIILAVDCLEKVYRFEADDNGIIRRPYSRLGLSSGNKTEVNTGYWWTGNKRIEFSILDEVGGFQLKGIRYEQLLPYVKPEGDAFRVVTGDFVTTTDGTGIVHIAPTFGSDDFRVAKQNNIPFLMVPDEDGRMTPLVDRTGKFVKEMGEFAGRYVKDYKDEPDYVDVNVDICIKLKKENRAFKVEKYEHNYPHCWRTDKPVLYYPLDSWFIKSTAAKDRMVELNKTINWKPASTGTGRFGNWLEELQDWNLSRSRFWGVPLPVWRTEDSSETRCIGSVGELIAEAEKGVAAGFTKAEDLAQFKAAPDLHRPWVDRLVLVSSNGKPMNRETDLIDVWFDSGSMPYAQNHYMGGKPAAFPADFIAEGVDQTRGWFFTLHAIAVMLFDSVAYKSVVSNGLVLDKEGVKMSKRLGNVVDPFYCINKYGADATRWYMIYNSPPWENLKFSWERVYTDANGKTHVYEGKKAADGFYASMKLTEEHSPAIQDAQRRFFGTLYNTYQFFALYANIDGWKHEGARIPFAQRSELDKYILSLLNRTIQESDEAFADFDPTRAVRAVENFLERLSNWYVRLNRRRFWKGDPSADKEAAYQTLYECLLSIAKLMSPVAPFFSERLYGDLNGVTGLEPAESVHLSLFPVANAAERDDALVERMEMAQGICSLVHSIRKQREVNIRLRQPLSRILIPVLDGRMKDQIGLVEELILNETNVKQIQYITDNDPDNVIVKKVKPDFKALGPRLGARMKAAGPAIQGLGKAGIATLEREGKVTLDIGGEPFELMRSEVEIVSQDIPGWKVASDGSLTVALDVTLTPELEREGLARELVNRIQNLRKDAGLEVTDSILVQLTPRPEWTDAINEFLPYICAETLTRKLDWKSELAESQEIELNGIVGQIKIEKDYGN